MAQTPGDADGAALGLQVVEGRDRQVNMVGRTLGAHVVDWHDQAGERRIFLSKNMYYFYVY